MGLEPLAVSQSILYPSLLQFICLQHGTCFYLAVEAISVRHLTHSGLLIDADFLLFRVLGQLREDEGVAVMW